MTKTKQIVTSNGDVMLKIEATYDSGAIAYAHWTITHDGTLLVNQSEQPQNPTATIEDMKALIETWEKLHD